MAELDINDLASLGVVRDEPAYQLPPEVWTTALNMRAKDNGLAKMLGWSQVFGTPGVAPHFALPIVSSAAAFWLYVSLTKAYVWDGSSHTDITRAAGGDYTTTNTRQWNGTILAGIPILNNGADAPQYWGTLSTGTKLTPLTAWPASTTAAVIRAFGAYLVAINITKSGTNYPHLVKWSAETTAAGTLPSSWDEADETLDAGEYDLYDVNAGLLREAMTLAGKLYLYKDSSTWVMRWVGGREVFAFDPLYETSGILAPRCVSITGDSKNHVVATQDDLIVHQGGQPASILNKKLRREIFNNIDTTNYVNSFTYVDIENTEVLFCYPESGQTYPNRAIVFNYRTGAITEKDGITYRNAATGKLETSSEETWASTSGTWGTDDTPWNVQQRRRTLLCGTADTKFFLLNDGLTRNGAAFTGTLQRIGLSVIGKKRTGEWIVNHQVMKLVDRLWPKVQGGPIQVRIGYQEVVDGPVTWGAYQTLDPSVDVFCDPDPPVSGRAIALEFTSQNDWRIDGYRINVIADSEF